MEREKILVNFRTFKAYKNCLDSLSKKRGISATQLVNQVLFNEFMVDIVKTAHDDALQSTALSYNLPNYLTIRYSHNRDDELRSALGDRYVQFGKDWADQILYRIESYCKEMGFESNDVEYTAIMKEFADGIRASKDE
jgi:hypothetical protein